MPDKSSEKPELAGRGNAQVRAERRAAALRENLKRRKQQARGRAKLDASGDSPPLTKDAADSGSRSSGD